MKTDPSPQLLPEADGDGPSEEEYRRAVRSRFTDVEIDLILDLVANVPLAIWAASGEAHDFAVRLWSPGAEMMYGFTKAEILGKNYIEMFVNRLERRQAISDHKRTEEERKFFRNLARDQRRDKTTRLMLTQGTALWHPQLRHYLQGEVTVDATEVPIADRSWLEQVLTPEAAQSLLDRFIAMTQAAFISLEDVTKAAETLIKVFLGESAECLVFIERPGTRLVQVGHGEAASSCEFDPKAVIEWCMRSGRSTLIVDYGERQPPIAGFPDRLYKAARPAPFTVGILHDETERPRGGAFIYWDPNGELSELTEGILAAVSGTLKLALVIEDKISIKERERQATVRLAHQYMHAVHKKADLLDFYSDLLLEEMNPERISQIAIALSFMSKNLIDTGKDFESNLRPENLSLADMLNSVTGAVMNAHPEIQVTRDDFPDVEMYGIRPFIEGAFENLLLNAIEAQQYRGEVGVMCSPIQDDHAQLYINVFICDNGPGLSDEIRAKVEKSERATTKGDARGFGLVIARRTLAECGGEIYPETNPLSGWRGACFRVRVPVQVKNRGEIMIDGSNSTR